MSTNTTTAPRVSATGFALPRHTPASGKAVLQLLQKLQVGMLNVELPDRSQQQFGRVADDRQDHKAAQLHVKDWSVFSSVLKSGDIGFGEAYADGQWDSRDLVGLLRLLLANRNTIERVVYGHWWGRLWYRLQHLLNHNSKVNSQRNIHAHYDLGNAFYRLWLDETMNYSSAWFQTPEQSLPDAQRAKVQRALTLANVGPGDRVLEIGCGWGALAEMGAADFGAHITGVTLSTEQLTYARQRLDRLGLLEKESVGVSDASQGSPKAHQHPRGAADLAQRGRAGADKNAPGATFRLQDYRDIQDEPFDAICSIEMVEAVGQTYWPQYFSTVARLLKPGGRACIQSIVIDDALFDRYVSGTDFIQQYIFPGGCLPSPSRFKQQAERAGLEVVDTFAFGRDYARTLKMWREQFQQQSDAVLAQGFDQRFLRLWEFYLAYCEAAFWEANIDVMQFTLRKPD